MEDLESSSSIEESKDLCMSLLSRFSNSTQEDHQHLCAVIGAMSQELKDQKLPLTPIAYFGATISSLDRLSIDSEPSDPVIAALITLQSMILPKVSIPVLRKKRTFVLEPLLRVLRSESASVGAVISGLKCISYLIVIGDKVSWSEISQLYGLLLGFVTNTSPKVRKQTILCLRDVLQNFQRSAMLVLASEGITNIFERLLLLAGGPNSAESEGPRGAQEVLYILDALKDCLPLMSMKFITSILKYFKSLLELHQPLVTRRITDSLYALCLHPTSEISPEALLDLLCSLALSASLNEKSVDSLTSTARLLDVGIKKVYSLNRQICVVKLPVVFSALGEILSCEHEEALLAAMEALRSLIQACVDEGLIKQGVDKIMMNEDGDKRRVGPTIIEKICATIESLLGYQYNAVWDMAFKVISPMFDKLGEHSSYLLRGTLKSLADMQKMTDEDLPYRKQLHECVGSALGAMGPETFLSIIPLNLESEDPSEASVWLFPILKQYTVGACLSFFSKSILVMVKLLRQKSQKLEQEGRIFSSRSAEALVYSLWSLLPSFCHYPIDTANSFKGLEKELCHALREEPDVRGVICSSLKILIQQNKRLVEENNDLPTNEISIHEQRARACLTPQVAADNLNTLRSSAREFLFVLSGVFLKSSKDSGGCLQSTISEFASIADKAVVKRFFTETMQRLLKVTQEAVKAEQPRNSNSMQIDSSRNESSTVLARAQLFDLAVSLLPGLGAKGIDVLFLAIKPALQDNESLVQKKAYKALSIILRDHEEFLSTKLDDLLKLMIEVLPSCHFSAKHHRLDCLYFLITHVFDWSKDQSKQRKCDIFLTEIILALKEANKKTRNRAYDMLIQIGHACGDEEKGGKKENLLNFFNMVAGGLAGETPQMISATVKGLARLAYEFSDLVSAAYNVLPSAFLLLQRKNREIIKANLGLVKVLVAKSQAERLQTHLKSMVEGLLKWQDDTKNHFKAKVKLLLEMLVRKCGLDAVKAVMPEEHMKLLTNIRKIKERKERKIASNSERETKSLQSKATTSRLSRWNHTKIFSDFGDEDSDNSDVEYMETMVSGRRSASSQFNSKASSFRSKQTRRSAKSLPEDLFDQLEDDPLDLLDRQKTRSALRSSEHFKRKQESDDEPEIDSEGRLVIREGGNSKRPTSSECNTDTRSQAGSHLSSKSSSKTQMKRRKTSDSGWAYTGNEYASKKAGGDVKRKDKLEPYAYWPLDRKMMSRRPEHRAAARKGMASVVKLTKRLEGKSVSSALSAKGGLKFKRKQKNGSKKTR